MKKMTTLGRGFADTFPAVRESRKEKEEEEKMLIAKTGVRMGTKAKKSVGITFLRDGTQTKQGRSTCLAGYPFFFREREHVQQETVQQPSKRRLFFFKVS
jgi:hypothetical protein